GVLIGKSSLLEVTSICQFIARDQYAFQFNLPRMTNNGETGIPHILPGLGTAQTIHSWSHSKSHAVWYVPHLAESSPLNQVQQLSKNSKQTLTEAEILQLRGHDGFSLLEIAVERFNPTVATVAKTLNDLELDNALSILIPFVFLNNAVETCGSTVNYRTNDSFKTGKPTSKSSFDDLVKLLLRLDEQHQTFGPIRFTTDRTDMKNCELGALEFTRKQSTDLTRRTFVCPDDQPRASRAACSELRILQRFRHPGLPP
ncbi:hypothetical protein X801_09476, partial [Opisthorchis viverrini]